MSLLLFVQFLTQVWVYTENSCFCSLLLIPSCVSFCFGGEFVLTCPRSVNFHVTLLESSAQLLIDWGPSPSLISYQEHQVLSLHSSMASGWAAHLYFSCLIPFLHCLSHPWALKGCDTLKEILIPSSPMVWPCVLSLTRCISFPVMKN